jgi:NTE family protein
MKALVLSGGGSRGSWEAGALQYLGEHLSHGFEFISGTSVGSINAAGLAMYSEAEFKAATEYLVHIWKLRWPLGIPALWEPSLGTNDQLEKLLAKTIDVDKIKKSGIKLRLPSVDLKTGTLHSYTEEDIVKLGIAPIMASASFPVAFPPVTIGLRWETDGGVIDMAPLGQAIAAGADDITVLVTRDPYEMSFKRKSDLQNTIQVALRVIDIMTQTVLDGDLKTCQLVNQMLKHGVQFKGKRPINLTILYPLQPLGEPLDFTGDMMRRQIMQGYDDAQSQMSDDT